MASNPQQGNRSPRNPNQQKPNQQNRNQQKRNQQNHAKNNPGPQGQQHSQPKDSSSQQLYSQAGKELECPECQALMKPPIYLCEAGHSLCQPCTLRISPPVCPLCNSKITLQRNIALEGIAQKLTVLCHNSVYGCDHRCLAEELPAHFQSCSFLQTFCPMARMVNELKCSWHGKLSDLYSHMKEIHPDNIRLDFGREIVFQDFSVHKADKDLQVMRCQGKLFLYHVKVDPAQSLAFWAIQLVGSAEEACNWKYELQVYNAAQPMRKVSCSEPCTSDADNLQDLFAAGRCAVVPLKVVSTYIRGGRFTFKVFAFKENNNKNMNLEPLMKDLPKYQKNK